MAAGDQVTRATKNRDIWWLPADDHQPINLYHPDDRRDGNAAAPAAWSPSPSAAAALLPAMTIPSPHCRQHHQLGSTSHPSAGTILPTQATSISSIQHQKPQDDNCDANGGDRNDQWRRRHLQQQKCRWAKEPFSAHDDGNVGETIIGSSSDAFRSMRQQHQKRRRNGPRRRPAADGEAVPGTSSSRRTRKNLANHHVKKQRHHQRRHQSTRRPARLRLLTRSLLTMLLRRGNSDKRCSSGWSSESTGTQTDAQGVIHPSDGAVEVVPVKVVSALPISSTSSFVLVSSSSTTSSCDDDSSEDDLEAGISNTAGVNADQRAGPHQHHRRHRRRRRRGRRPYHRGSSAAAAFERETVKLTASVGNAVCGTGLALVLAGLLMAALGVYGYTIPGGGRYYLGFGLFSGVTTSLAGCAGLKAGRKFGDKHFVRGYVVLVGFSVLTTMGLLVLSYLAIARHPGRVVDALAGSSSCLACLVALVDTLALALCCCYRHPKKFTTSSPRSTNNISTTNKNKHHNETKQRRLAAAAVVVASSSRCDAISLPNSSSTAHLVETSPEAPANKRYSTVIVGDTPPSKMRTKDDASKKAMGRYLRRNSMKAKTKLFDSMVNMMAIRGKIGDLVVNAFPSTSSEAKHDE